MRRSLGIPTRRRPTVDETLDASGFVATWRRERVGSPDQSSQVCNGDEALAIFVPPRMKRKSDREQGSVKTKRPPEGGLSVALIRAESQATPPPADLVTQPPRIIYAVPSRSVSRKASFH